MKKIILLLFAAAIALPAFAQKKEVVITTEYGDIVMMLYDKAPLHRDNMLKLIKDKYYDGTIFHRVIPGFVIQGGDPDSKNAAQGAALGEGGPGYTVPAEIVSDYYHKRGAVGMARDNNPAKASSGSQFYIVVGKKFTDDELDAIEKRRGQRFTDEQRKIYKTQGGTPHLDGNYTVYGEVVEGMDVVDKIANEARDGRDRPNKDIKMEKVRKKKKFLIF